MLLFCRLVLLLVLLAPSAYAQGNIELGEGIRDELGENKQDVVDAVDNKSTTDSDISFENDDLNEINAEQLTLLDGISSAISGYAQKNILASEQVFCYQVATPPENYAGYTLDGMAIVGFCGVIDGKLRNMIISQLMNNPEHIVFDQFEDCIIRPQIMLRFLRGVDSTDVLLSSPCHALAFFYGGKLTAFNAKPAATIIDSLVRSLLKNKIDFVSPTLFNQLLPAGVAKTDEQKKLLQEKNTPFRRWEQQKQEEEIKNSGWNKLKNR